MKFPNSDLPHIQHSNFLLSQGDTLNSMKELQHAVDKNTQFKNVYLFLVQQYQRIGQFSKAEEIQLKLNKITGTQ